VRDLRKSCKGVGKAAWNEKVKQWRTSAQERTQYPQGEKAGEGVIYCVYFALVTNRQRSDQLRIVITCGR